MKTNILRPTVFLMSLLSASAASAQVEVSVRVPLPTVRFEVAPPLVVVAPGIQVVEDYDEEVFYVGGWYWLWWSDGWYRSRDHFGGWVLAPVNSIPASVRSLPRGKYKHFKAKHEHGGGGGGGPGHHVKPGGGGGHKGGGGKGGGKGGKGKH